MPGQLSATEREKLNELINSDPVAWMERNFYIPDPRDPVTGRLLPAGPIQLHPIQKCILRAALTKVDGRFPYSTVLYSTIKKSGKTRVGAGIAAWYAATQGAYNEVYCLANDGKQSSDRILSAVRQCLDLNPRLGWRKTKTTITLPNGTFIEAIPCDPSGQAGANPGLTVWSELWGYRHEHKERLWSEMTIPPTRFGQALRFVESYAGYTGESNVLHDLYTIGVKGGRRHPVIKTPPIYLNDAARMIAYWDDGDAARRMPWQQGEDGAAYYRQESLLLSDSEFERLHRNKWVDPITKAIPIEWWDACLGRVPPLAQKTPIVVGVDASVSGDCSACVAVSRHPDKQKADTDTVVRLVRVFTPPKGGKIDLTLTVERTIREWIERYQVMEVTYDEYQLHKMMTDIRKEKIVKLHPFGQSVPRAKSDKQLYDMIKQRQITHDGGPVLRAHVDNAYSKTTGDEKLRFVKADKSSATTGRARKQRPIDALVALSMANERCLWLRLN